MIVVGIEMRMGRKAEKDDSLRVETFGLVYGGMADATWNVFLFDAFAEVSACKDTAVAKWTFENIGLGMQDEHVGWITESGLFSAGEDGFD